MLSPGPFPCPVPGGRPFATRAAALLTVLGLLVAPAADTVAGERRGVALGALFPDMEFSSLLTPEDYRTLGLPAAGGSFHLSEIPGQVLVLEFFSQYCITCQRQASYLNEFFHALRESDLAERVHLLTVGVGSLPKNLLRFREEQQLAYPISPDPLFERLMELGDVAGTPFTVFLLRQEEGWIVADSHLGVQGGVELMARTRVLLEGRFEVVTAEASVQPGKYRPPLGLSDVQQEQRARELLSRVAGEEVRVVTVDLPNRGRVFRAVNGTGGASGLYARIASRDPVCDVCHAIHFLFVFDRHGTVRGFDPIHVTKYGNEAWGPEETAQLRSRLLDRRMAELAFDADVDAVTSATMSSALIFDAVRRAADLPALLGAL